MAVKKGGLGRGFDSLFIDNTALESSSGAMMLSIDDVEPNRAQPRKAFDEKALSELADSISQYGILQPLLVRPRKDGSYQIVAGERRWRAAKIAGLKEVPATVRDLTDDETAAIALIENLQREDLNPIEQALGLSELIETYGLTQEEAAFRVGKSRPAVANSLRLLKLPEDIREGVSDGKISEGHARALLGFENEEDMRYAASLILKDKATVREIEKMAKAKSAKKPRKAKKTAKRDVYFDEVELSLASSLARRVKVYNNPAGGGKIEIEFFDKEDLKKIANEIGKE
ncbi:MAG: ParB/RepB/Spo0J family partition protein [Ruminococcaceae bacterium]|jgi:ParB family chromosome partitioning protein|nr:ParB/RepB/Spo0J family partition protein [Oscillospiraceae bacterium]